MPFRSELLQQPDMNTDLVIYVHHSRPRRLSRVACSASANTDAAGMIQMLSTIKALVQQNAEMLRMLQVSQ